LPCEFLELPKNGHIGKDYLLQTDTNPREIVSAFHLVNISQGRHFIRKRKKSAFACYAMALAKAGLRVSSKRGEGVAKIKGTPLAGEVRG